MRKGMLLLLALLFAAGWVLWYGGSGRAMTWTFPLEGVSASASAVAPTPLATATQAGGFYYGPVNCHTSPVLPTPTGDRKQYADYIVNTIAPRYHLEAAVLLWQVQQESGFNPNAYSSAGAIGIAQFMPAIAAAYHINPWDPWQSLDAMARYDLASLFYPDGQGSHYSDQEAKEQRWIGPVLKTPDAISAYYWSIGAQ